MMKSVKRRAVSGAARAWSADERDLRHRARKHHIGVEHLSVAGERIDALLHARAARIVNEDKWRAGFQGLLHDLGHLDRMDFAGRTARHREILTGKMHEPAADRGGAGYHAVGREGFVGHAEQNGPVFGEQAGLFETPFVHHQLDSFSGGLLPLSMLLLQLVDAAALHRLLAPLPQFFDSLLHRFIGHFWLTPVLNYAGVTVTRCFFP